MADSRPPEIPQICFKDICFQLEVAVDPETRRKGLMDRPMLAQEQGMLFVFPGEERYSIWMKNMRFSIDILWLDSGLKIVHVVENVPPCTTQSCESIYPQAAARYVLELPSGTVSNRGLNLGMTGTLTGL